LALAVSILILCSFRRRVRKVPRCPQCSNSSTTARKGLRVGVGAVRRSIVDDDDLVDGAIVL
jgi:hypothetical protein